MKRAAIAAITSALLVATPTFIAQARNTPPNIQNQSAQQRQNAQGIVDSAAKSIRRMESNRQLDRLLRRAEAVFIVPTFFKGAIIVGGEGGAGVLLAHKNGRWSDPAFLSVASGSIGPQIGGEAGPLVMVLMTRKALAAFSGPGNFSLNANAGLTIVNFSARRQANVGKADVVLWSGTSGGFIGASISGTGISPDLKLDESYYGKPVGTNQILAGAATNPGASRLRSALPT